MYFGVVWEHPISDGLIVAARWLMRVERQYLHNNVLPTAVRAIVRQDAGMWQLDDSVIGHNVDNDDADSAMANILSH